MTIPTVNYLEAVALQQRCYKCGEPVLNSLERFGGLCWTSSVGPSRSCLQPALCPGRLTGMIPFLSWSSGFWFVWPVVAIAGDQWRGTVKLGSVLFIVLTPGSLLAGCFSPLEATI